MKYHLFHPAWGRTSGGGEVAGAAVQWQTSHLLLYKPWRPVCLGPDSSVLNLGPQLPIVKLHNHGLSFPYLGWKLDDKSR
jgi:hypothetical protein